MNKTLTLIITIYIFCTQALIAQSNHIQADSLIPGEIVSVIPGPEYKAGWWHEVFFGEHWRSLWTTPIDVQVLDLKSYAGGLTVIKRGGGFQTKSLHFKGNDGKYYKFRSINKDPKKVLPREFRNTFVADVVQDQISTSHPLSACIAAPLLSAVGVLNTHPKIVVLPDDPILGEFREDFSRVLGTFAENPKDDTEAELIFAGADKIIKLYDIFEKTESNNKNQVDAIAYLRARLMDVFLGDWDRHVGQWKWARFEKNGLKMWQPIPRDRDQAFSRYDGVFPWMAAKAVPQIESFNESYPQINDLTWSGRHLDRRFLTPIDKPDWDSVAIDIQTKLTDTVIESAVKCMPAEWFAKDGQRLIFMLKSRRDELLDISDDYYEYMSQIVSIYGSDKREFAEILRVDDENVKINIYRKDEHTGNKTGEILFTRNFSRDYTDEIRLDLLDGDDTAVLTGNVDKSILVRVIGGSGKDILKDSSAVYGYLLSLQPFRYYKNMTYFYDSGNNTDFITGPSTIIDRKKAREPKPYNEELDNVNEKYEPQIEDRDYDWKATSRFNFNSNDGFTLGAGPVLFKHSFRKYPYQYRLSLTGAYVTNLKAFLVDFNGDFYLTAKGNLDLKIGKSAGYTNFYGYGNETTVNEQLYDNKFYRLRFNIFNFVSNYVYKPNPEQYYWLGLSINDAEITYDSGSILDTLNLPNISRDTYYGLHLGIKFDYRDHKLVPFSGYYINLNSYNYPKFINSSRHYHRLLFDARAYLPLNIVTTSSIAFRVNIEKMWGEFPLHQSAFLGGQKNLRGFVRERFTGEALTYGGIELRSNLFKIRIILPAEFGFTAFGEAGRVFFPNDNSQLWHPSWGGGLWVSFLRKAFIFNTTIAKSDEDLQFYFTTGFMF